MRYLIVCSILLLGAPALADDSPERGGFGAPVMKVTQLDESTALLAGGRAGWIFDQRLVVGGGAYGHVTSSRMDDPIPDPRRLQLDYGGLELQYIGLPGSRFHYSLWVLTGMGGLTSHLRADQQDRHVTDYLFVGEASLNGEVDLLRWMRLSVGVGYRWVKGVDQPGLSDDDLRAPVATVALMLGDL